MNRHEHPAPALGTRVAKLTWQSGNRVIRQLGTPDCQIARSPDCLQLAFLAHQRQCRWYRRLGISDQS
jgi:hypothetical protein